MKTVKTKGIIIAEKVLSDFDKMLTILTPNMGKIEPYLANQPFLYRSIVVSRINKIVYRTHDNIVYIVALWDTRREPTKQAHQTIESLNL